MLAPPIEPMLAKLSDAIPEGDGWLFEPKWDGFRALVFKDQGEVYLQSRDLKPLARYFPEVVAALGGQLPARCVLDGEIVIAGARGLDFESLLLRIHPAKSRVELLAAETPASFVAWDLLFLDGEDLRERRQDERRARLEAALGHVTPPVHVTPVTRDRAIAADWFARFEGAGLDGVMAKRDDAPYAPGKRAMWKIKHARTADVVVAGFRWHKEGPGELVGSLVLGLYDGDGHLHNVGIASSFTRERRRTILDELAPFRTGTDDHPWRAWSGVEHGAGERRPGMTSRWNRGKDLSWQPLRVSADEGLVGEVSFDHMQGDRFRHATHLERWRPDKRPGDCRYDQLEVTPPIELSRLFTK